MCIRAPRPSVSLARRPGSTTSAWSELAASASSSGGSTTATCPAQKAGATETTTTRSRQDEYRSAARALGALAHPVHQGAGAVDAVWLGRPPGSCRQDRLDHQRTVAGGGVRRG